MIEKPKISIIIPVFNVEKYLNQCLDSLINQTFRDFEVILVDDNSTDNSYSTLKNYASKDNRFKIFKNAAKGAATARNKGIKEARGDYIQFLDSDDYFETELLEELYKKALENDCDITICSSRKVDDNFNIIETKNPQFPINLALAPINKPFNPKNFKESIFELVTPVPWNKLFKKSLIVDNKIQFPNLKIAEDNSFCHSAFICAKKIYIFNKELINYRFNRVGSHQSYRVNFAAEIIKAYLITKDFLIKKGVYDFYKTALINYFKIAIRAETINCNKKQLEDFIKKLKTQIPEWEIFKPALRNDKITADYLNKIIGKKRVMFWGNSVFIQNILKNDKKVNILGIIDKNEALQGKIINGYEIFAPEKINELKPDGIIMTVWNNWDRLYPILKKEIEKNYPVTKLLKNIFEEI